jgi:hypothetical protein
MSFEPYNPQLRESSKPGLLSRIATLAFKGCLIDAIVLLIAFVIGIVIIAIVLPKSCESESEEKATYNNPSLEKLISYIEQSGSRDDAEVQEYREAKDNEKTNEDSKVVETVEETKQTIVIDLDELGVDKETQDAVVDVLNSYL